MKYVVLMASLPPLGSLFEAATPPISRLKLESRLGLLESSDRHTLEQIANLIAWPSQPLERTDAAFLVEAHRFLASNRNPTLRRLVTQRLDMRTVVAAFRRRRRGEAQPPDGEVWGFGEWVGLIERNWSAPTFKLDVIFPWVRQAHDLLEEDDLIGFEKLQFSVVWTMLNRLGAGHAFDFEALIIYLARWSLVSRWSCYKGETAVARFRELVDAGLANHRELFSGVAQ
ncbi:MULTISPECIES: hypothetical protein [unclassified Cyanobium]|uniref:hypothetical protein n=1 Tax=unclassified Cyanobium TaxID=2627006 RepID=UPI0020CF1AF4|nr:MULTISPECIES: hypothetical protein [unclassified Cyanobium]MCP9859956.1 DUF2764 family protein [Cyanobium sp. Cruz-8H5]MCP9867144.1 DUF2764 family protein [Cyanobium sp. Cruz-8D1]